MSEWNKTDEPDPRQVAVAFYLSTLAAGVRGGGSLLLQAQANRCGPRFPECCQTDSIIEAALGGFAYSGPLTAKERKELAAVLHQYLGNLFWAKLKEARIFQFRPRDYGALYHLSDVFVTMAAGYRWRPSEEPVRQREVEKVGLLTCSEGVKVPFPAKLPFNSCYFAWGAGVEPPMALRILYSLDQNSFHLVMGTLLSSDGWVFTVILRGTKDSASFALALDGKLVGGYQHLIVLERIGEPAPEVDEVAMGTAAERRQEHERVFNPGWTLPFALTPWMVAYAVEAIDRNDSLTKVHPGLVKERMQYQALSKRSRQRFLPAPYYTVIVQPTTYEDIEHRIKSQPRDWSHRWDVRGHYGHRIVRGSLPIDPKLLSQLTKRRYQIFHALNRPSAEALAFLMRRRILPPREGEWLAYLRFRRDAFIKGPASKPYVPSVHRLKGGVPELV